MDWSNNSLPAKVYPRVIGSQYLEVIYQQVSKTETQLMDKYERRRQRLIELRDTHCGGSAADLARKIERDPSYVTRMLYQEGKPGKKRIADDMIEVIESAFNLTRGWLDGVEASSTTVEAGPAIRGRVPLISWVRAGDFCEAIDLFSPGDAEDWMSCPVSHSEYTYALRVRGMSMEPRFREGEIIIVDPKVSPDNGRFVIAKRLDANEVTLKQLVIEGGEPFLQALNPAWPERIIRLNEAWMICGVVICKMEVL